MSGNGEFTNRLDAWIYGLSHSDKIHIKKSGYFDTLNFKKSQLTRRLNKAKKSELYASEMDHFTDEYLDFAKASAMAYDATPHVAIEKRLDLTEYIPGGFGTADCIIIGDGVLHIIDLKYGNNKLTFKVLNSKDKVLEASATYDAGLVQVNLPKYIIESDDTANIFLAFAVEE